MTAPQRLYVPLRGNAHALVAGAPGHAFRRRLKVAALLFEELLLDEGFWLGLAGPRAKYEMSVPFRPEPGTLSSPTAVKISTGRAWPARRAFMRRACAQAWGSAPR